MVQGLTTFINQRSDIYMEKYTLHDTEVILDGSSICHRLFESNFHPQNSCFNGDYDRYADLVRHFFSILLDCNVTPYILFAGGYEGRRLERFTSSMLSRINTACNLNPASDGRLFPLCLVDTFKDVAKEFNIKMICCNCECDVESVKIANNLNCPLICDDSDFFIFDVLYIPFSTVKLRSVTRLETRGDGKQVYKYIPCEIFRRNDFLRDMHLEKKMMPLFAVLLGNNYITREMFQPLYRQFKGRNPITNLASFLANKTEDIIQEILTVCNITEEKDIANIYFYINRYKITKEEKSRYLRYFKYSELDSIIDDEEISTYVNITGASPQIISLFFVNFRRYLYPPYFLTILLYNVYHIRPQVENRILQSSHLVNCEIISAVHKILKPSSESLRFYTRLGLQYEEHLIAPCTIDVPLFIDIPNIDIHLRQQILLNILNIEESFIACCLDYFPDSWKLYIITIKYIYSKSDITWLSIYSLIFCKIIITYVDVKLAKFIRDPDDDIFQTAIVERAYPDLKNTIQESIEDITYEDSLLALKNVINLFAVKPELLNDVELFDRNIVHYMAEFQSCLFHMKGLNALLNSPFENCPMKSCFNGTFLYNFTHEMTQHSEDYIEDLLNESPTILNCFNLIVAKLKKHFDTSL